MPACNAILVMSTVPSTNILPVDISALLPEVQETLASLTAAEQHRLLVQNINLGFRVLQLSKIEVVGIDRPLNDIAQQLNKQVSHITELVDRSLTSNYNSFRTDVEKYDLRLNSYHDKLSTLTSSFNELSHNIYTSSTKGKIGENLMQQTLANHFPDAAVADTSKTANQADIHLSFPNHETVWIEVKTYSNAVPTKEVVKFKKEMQDNRVPFGIFVATTGITKHHSIEIEEMSYGGKLLYIPNVDPENKLVVIGLMMFRHMQATPVATTGAKDTECAERAERAEHNKKICELVLGEMEHLQYLGTFYTEMKKDLEKAFKKMSCDFDKTSGNILTKISDLEARYQKTVSRLEGILLYEKKTKVL